MTATALERFEAKYVPEPNTGCWLWIGYTDKDGYGQFWANGASVKAHRWSYEALVGPIPEGLTIDHLCRVSRCVNPRHLEPVTMWANTLRAPTICTLNVKKTHCARGHELSGDNLAATSLRRRSCRACARANSAAYQARRRGRRQP